MRSRIPLYVSMLLLIVGTAFAADEIHWSFTGPTSVTFSWRGSVAERQIRYGVSPSAYTQSAAGETPSPLPFSSDGPFWQANLRNLEADTLYYYQIADGPEHTFRTPPLRGMSGFVVYAEGDIGSTNSYRRMGPVQDLIAGDPPAFVLAVGDLTYGNTNGQDDVDQHFNDVMVWSQDAAYMPIWGNHEWDRSTDDLRNYKGRFDFPNPQRSSGAPWRAVAARIGTGLTTAMSAS